MPDDNSFTKEDAASLLADVRTEAEFGANGGDPMLARTSRVTLVIVSVLELLLSGGDPVAAVTELGSSVNERLSALENKSDVIEGFATRLDNVERVAETSKTEAVDAAVSAADDRINAALAKRDTGVIAPAPIDVTAANAETDANKNNGLVV